MPLHRPQRHRHLAGLLAPDGLHDGLQVKGIKAPCDELDIIEAYGGEGPGEPNAFDTYMVTPHCWDQGEAGKAMETKAFEAMHNPIRMRKFGIPSTWYEAFHTYGCKITETDTIYYCDNIEVGRHATLPALQGEAPFLPHQSGHGRRLARRSVPLRPGRHVCRLRPGLPGQEIT